MRRTLANKAVISGTGLHKGKPSTITFMPVAGATGIRFLKPDLTAPIKASLQNIATTVRGTNLSDGARMVYTVEHVLSACAGLGIDDVDIALEGEEPPAADGSALPFAKALKSAGFNDKPAQEREILRLGNPVEYVSGTVFYRAKASERPYFKMTFANSHPLIGVQTFDIFLTPESFLFEIAPARTFGFKSEIAELKASGLALGGSLDNAIILDDKTILNPKGSMRFANEFARHKLLDLIGDLALLGLRMDKISVEAVYTSHKTNAIFASMLAEQQ